MPDLAVLRDSLAAFADAVGFELADFQAEALACPAREVVIVGPRQSGKSRGLAVYAAHAAFREPGALVLCVSASESSAGRLLRMVREVVAAPLLGPSVVDEQSLSVELSNGSRVVATAASERAIRGHAATRLLLDEAALLGESIFAAALPTVVARDGRVVMASSAITAAGPFYDHAMRAEAGSEHARAFRWPLSECEWISPSWLASQRETMSAARFAAEFEGRFSSGADRLFPAGVLDAATVGYLPAVAPGELRGPAAYLCGLDWGWSRDRSTFVALGRLAVPGPPLFGAACVTRWGEGADNDRIVAEVAACPAPLAAVASESVGLGVPITARLFEALARRELRLGGGRRGLALVDPLTGVADGWRDEEQRRGQLAWPEAVAERMAARRSPTRLVSVATTQALKAACYASLRLLLGRGRLVIPASAEELRRELLSIDVEVTEQGGERIGAARGHDDLSDALAFALVPRRRRDGGWTTALSRLAERRLPDGPPELGAGPTVPGPTGPVPVRPAWMSVDGGDVTPPARTDVPAHARDRDLWTRYRQAIKERKLA